MSSTAQGWKYQLCTAFGGWDAEWEVWRTTNSCPRDGLNTGLTHGKSTTGGHLLTPFIPASHHELSCLLPTPDTPSLPLRVDPSGRKAPQIVMPHGRCYCRFNSKNGKQSWEPPTEESSPAKPAQPAVAGDKRKAEGQPTPEASKPTAAAPANKDNLRLAAAQNQKAPPTKALGGALGSILGGLGDLGNPMMTAKESCRPPRTATCAQLDLDPA